MNLYGGVHRIKQTLPQRTALNNVRPRYERCFKTPPP
nr:MAG TPA: hypothetical protein [Caudoviricetes sp.]